MTTTKYIDELERLIRVTLRTFSKHLNTMETRTIKRAVKRLGIVIATPPTPTDPEKP